MALNEGNDVADFAKYFFRNVPTGNALVVIPNSLNIDERFRRLNCRASASGHIT
jgi:hypothetical protein